MPCGKEQIRRWWRSPTVLLCLYGLVKELRPSEVYITLFLTKFKNITEKEAIEIIFPVATYSTMGLLVVVFLVTDALLYRPIIVLQAISCSVTASLLILANGIPMLVVAELVYGLLISCDVAYLTYLYATVETDQYARVSALCRVAHLLGRLLSGIVAQAMISLNLLNYMQLQYISLASGCAGCVVALSLPAPRGSLYFHRREEEPLPPEQAGNAENTRSRKLSRCSHVLGHIKLDLRAAYTQPYVLAWSAWWVVTNCVYLQVLSYVQVLWLSQTPDANDQKYNGYVEAAYTLLGAGGAWLAGQIKWRFPWITWTTLSGITFIYAILLIFLVVSHQILVEYILYISYGILYFAAMTVASSEVAQKISSDSTALIFGMNTFISLVLESALTATITAKGGLELSIQKQFLVYGGIHISTAVVFMTMAMLTCCMKRKSNANPVLLTERSSHAEKSPQNSAK